MKTNFDRIDRISEANLVADGFDMDEWTHVGSDPADHDHEQYWVWYGRCRAGDRVSLRWRSAKDQPAGPSEPVRGWFCYAHLDGELAGTVRLDTAAEARAWARRLVDLAV
jgi:hypothetical protein